MPLTEAEFDWIEYTSGKNVTAESHEAALARSAARESFLAEQMGPHLDDVQEFIRESQDLVISRDASPALKDGAWRKAAGAGNGKVEMPWRATDDDLQKAGLGKWAMLVDVEVDTREDISAEVDEIPASDIAKLREGYERALEIQKRMEMQIGADGMPLFTDDDIRREVWTPLVRSGLIPDNIVPERYSEHAVAFSGAAQFYEQKIEQFSATTTSGREKFKLGMRVTKEVVQLAGTLTAGAITIGNSTEVASKNQDLTQKRGERTELDKQIKGLDTSSPSYGTDKAALEQAKGNIDDRIKLLSRETTLLNNEPMYVQQGTAILMGGLSAVELVDEHRHSSDEDAVKWSKTVEKAVGIAQSISVAAVKAGMTASQDNPSTPVNKAKISYVTSAMGAAFASAKVLPGLVLAMKEPDWDKRVALINKMVSGLADAVAAGINASAQKALSKADPNAPDYGAHRDHAAAQAQIASALALAIKQAGNGAEIARAIQSGNKGKVAMLLGSGAVASVFGGLSETVYDGVRSDMDSDDKADLAFFQQAYTESSSQSVRERGQDSGSASAMDQISSALSQMDSITIDNMPNATEEDLRDLSEEIEGSQARLAEEELAKAFSPEGMQAMMESVDAQLAGFDEVYSKAFPDPAVESRTPEEIVEAAAAIDRAMANTNELRQKVAIINGISATGAAVLGALVPGMGAVVAAQKLVADLYALKKSVETHNTWVESMGLAFTARAGTAPAIEKTLANAKIHLDHNKIKVVLDAVQVSAQAAKVFDPTGVAAIVGASTSMASAVVEFGYKMHKEVEIKNGWNAYKKAREDPKNRKRARAALRMNSTLAKCCVAYGASIMGDPSAQQAMRASGLTVAALKNDKDICVKLIGYLENELNEDPVVLGVEKKTSGKWQPGKPDLSLVSWTAYKAAANRSASPKLTPDSTKTPGIDRCLAELAGLDHWRDHEKFAAARTVDDGMPEDAEPAAGALSQDLSELTDTLGKAASLLERLDSAFSAYKPVAEGIPSTAHSEMADAAAAFATLARMNAAGVRRNIDLVTKYPAEIAA